MTHLPLVSVVIPTYNAPALLLETVETVFAQTFRDYEIVVINDGSTDDTSGRLRPLVEAGRIRLIEQANGGIGNARNRGIDEARGKYVALLDHDDLWKPGKLAAQVAYAEGHPACSIVTCRWSFSTAPDRCVFSEGAIGASGVIERPLRQMAQGQMLFCSSSMFFEKRRAEGLRYGTERRCIEDQQFHFGLLGRGALGCAGEEVLMVYRMHDANYSSQAEYWYNGVRRLRQMDRGGAFAALRADGGNAADLDALLAHFGRTAAAKQLLAGRRGRAVAMYAWEFAAQAQEGRVKFLASFPLLLGAPRGLLLREQRW